MFVSISDYGPLFVVILHRYRKTEYLEIPVSTLGTSTREITRHPTSITIARNTLAVPGPSTKLVREDPQGLKAHFS
jgi:hypothetical protein